MITNQEIKALERTVIEKQLEIGLLEGKENSKLKKMIKKKLSKLNQFIEVLESRKHTKSVKRKVRRALRAA